MQLIIKSHGPLIVASNYWDLPECQLGKILVSTNAGAFRVLLPPVAEPCLDDMRSATECVISRGPWPAASVPDAVEVLFDDASADPFALHLSVAAFDRLPLDSDADHEWVLSVWTRPRRGRPHKALERPCWYRRVGSIPYLKPRGE